MDVLLRWNVIHINAAVDIECLPGDVVPVHNQIANGSSYFLGRADAPERNAFEYSFFDFIRHGSVHIRLDETGADRVNGNIGTRELDGRRFGKTNDAGFRG